LLFISVHIRLISAQKILKLLYTNSVHIKTTFASLTFLYVV
jgi:hypothetical protein